MKKVFITALLFALFTGCAFAQKGKFYLGTGASYLNFFGNNTITKNDEKENSPKIEGYNIFITQKLGYNVTNLIGISVEGMYKIGGKQIYTTKILESELGLPNNNLAQVKLETVKLETVKLEMVQKFTAFIVGNAKLLDTKSLALSINMGLGTVYWQIVQMVKRDKIPMEIKIRDSSALTFAGKFGAAANVKLTKIANVFVGVDYIYFNFPKEMQHTNGKTEKTNLVNNTSHGILFSAGIGASL